MTHEERVAHIQAFANKHKIVMQLEGEVGFGRACVGLLHGDSYIDYNPYVYPDFEPVTEFHDERLFDCVPERAYHKHQCVAVLGHDEESVKQVRVGMCTRRSQRYC
jgi:hypothetical protein